MSTTTSSPAPATRAADPLVWGRGPKTLEVFLEPTCPFSARAFAKFDDLLARAGEDRLTLKLRLLSQPWHLFSPVITRAILAASTTEGGKTAARAVMAAVFAQRDRFEPTDHCAGPLLDCSARALLALIEQHSGVALTEAFARPALQVDLKWQAKYARQNGIHVTPTFMIDGLVAPDMGSGEPVEAWLDRLGLA
ncbi:thioredoxin-like protein [Sphaerotilus hippei]|uniref:Thioredoxin-like protein n=1 Tax=Sphaerotilus hippei TaxID=744406 RepID=A0A318H3X6_9BURK|nr:thioredoxin domain-containing protein [Sphaerotilus hippei]PXW97614.1 thioredoxin-like protein [Sphaerotilus hippei]